MLSLDSAATVRRVFPLLAVWAAVAAAPAAALAGVAPTATITSLAANTVVDSTVTFDTTGTGDDDGDLESYEVDFGDGSAVLPGSGAPPSTIDHLYSSPGPRTVTLTVKDSEGSTAQGTTDLYVFTAPSAALPAPSSVVVGVPAIFSPSVVLDPADAVASYIIDYGDGTYTSAVGGLPPTTSHAYAAADTYTATLYAYTQLGYAEASATVVVDAAPPSTNRPPVAALSGTPLSGEPPLFARFSTAGSRDPDGASDIASYVLYFGDGSAPLRGSGLPPATVTHAYRGIVTATAKLVLTDRAGVTSTATKTVSVPKATVNLTADPVTATNKTATTMVIRPVAHLERRITRFLISDKKITFKTVAGKTICVATTSSKGVATCVATVPRSTTGYTATLPADAYYVGASSKTAAILGR